MNPLNKEWFYKGFRKQMKNQLGPEKTALIWSEAGEIYASFDPTLKSHKGAMTLPAVALYRALYRQGEDAETLLYAYGDHMGKRLAGIVHALLLSSSSVGVYVSST